MGDRLIPRSGACNRGAPVETLAVHGDLGDAATVDRMVAEIHAAFLQIDILVHAAGGDIGAAGKPDPNDAVFVSMADIEAVLNRNLMSTILVCRCTAPVTAPSTPPRKLA